MRRYFGLCVICFLLSIKWQNRPRSSCRKCQESPLWGRWVRPSYWTGGWTHQRAGHSDRGLGGPLPCVCIWGLLPQRKPSFRYWNLWVPSWSCWLSVPILRVKCQVCKLRIAFFSHYSQVCLVHLLRTRSALPLLFMETDQGIRSMELVQMWTRRFQVSFHWWYMCVGAILWHNWVTAAEK